MTFHAKSMKSHGVSRVSHVSCELWVPIETHPPTFCAGLHAAGLLRSVAVQVPGEVSAVLLEEQLHLARKLSWQKPSPTRKKSSTSKTALYDLLSGWHSLSVFSKSATPTRAGEWGGLVLLN